jgi:hypothetical protein
MLVEPNGHGDVRLTQFDVTRGKRQQRIAGGAATQCRPGGQTGHADQPRDRLRIGDFEAAGPEAVHVGPRHAGIGQRASDRHRAHFQCRSVRVSAERVQTYTDDGDLGLGRHGHSSAVVAPARGG